MNTLTERDPAEPIGRAIRNHLEDLRRSIRDEIRRYPQPIAGCDAQFQHLYEERDRISRELDRLDAIRRRSLGPSEHIAAIDAFIASSPCFDDETARKIRADLTGCE